MIVTRFAPSPTGHLHIGGARTAVFAWLLARSRGGAFLLRIEDTDKERSRQEYTDAILQSLAWLGLDWDGEPVYQSERAARHNELVDRLVASGHAYRCSCSPQDVEAMREKARMEGRKPKYDGRCRELGLGPGPDQVVRFKTPTEGATGYVDLVKGHVGVENSELDDMILRRSDGSPTYNLAVVADDHDMGVTHVLRGDDHVANTPRQILLYRALGWETPAFGHVPLILGKDKKKLSKRHGALSTYEYRHQGVLPQALFNYLVRLGWGHGDLEIFSRDELLGLFDTKGLSKSPAAFDPDKLAWLNAHYLKESAPEDLVPLVMEHLEETSATAEAVARLAPLFQARAKTPAEMADLMRFLFVEDADLAYDPKAVKKFLTPEHKAHLRAVLERLQTLDVFSEESTEAAVAAHLEASGVKMKEVAQPVRVALTGGTVSPGLYETMAALGKDRVLARMEQALALDDTHDVEAGD